MLAVSPVTESWVQLLLIAFYIGPAFLYDLLILAFCRQCHCWFKHTHTHKHTYTQSPENTRRIEVLWLCPHICILHCRGIQLWPTHTYKIASIHARAGMCKPVMFKDITGEFWMAGVNTGFTFGYWQFSSSLLRMPAWPSLPSVFSIEVGPFSFSLPFASSPSCLDT